MSPWVADIEAAVDSVLQAYHRPGLPGVSVGVLAQGEVRLRKGYGLADIAGRRPNAPDVPMRIASLSKQFLVTVVLMLEAEGALSIDDDVHRYLPDLPDYGTPVTLRDLMSNQSGVRDFLELRLLCGGNFSDPATADESYALVKSASRLNFRPGTAFAYSNSGFMLLTLIVERLEGRSLESVLQSRLLSPLGMTQTHLARSDIPWLAQRAVPYVVENGCAARGEWSIPLDGAGGMISSIDDLLKWARYVADPASPHAAHFRRMARARPYADGTDSPYGLGFTVMPYRGLDSFGHHGQLPGVFAEIAWFPQIDAALVLLANTTEINPFHLGRRLADALFPAALAPRFPPEVVPPGHYYDPGENRVLRVLRQPDGENYLDSAMTRAPVEWHQAGRFRPYWPMLHLQLAAQDDALVGHDGPRAVAYRRLPTGYAGAPERFTGTFYLPGLESLWRISLHDGQLTLALTGRFGTRHFHLTPLTDEVLIATPAQAPDGHYRPTLRITGAHGQRRLMITTDRTSRLVAGEMLPSTDR
ncbi:serine hydrolase domain-containing protein [Acerihabitans sp.]|uniref:serine hydrolase domain-containing protein n=1 Tax=Acerihabitans sp. TaxID=2811394 RepID=UPI002ED80F61